MARTAKHVNRRIFLRGLGGACVAAPFLSSLGARGVKAQATPAPRRLIVMFTHYGCITTRFWPTKSHGALSADELQPTTLRVLAPYLDKLLIPRGMRSMNEWTQDMSQGQGNDPQLQACASYFTCQPVTPNSNNPFSYDESTKYNATPVGPSLDHVIAQQLSPSGTPFLMRVGNTTDVPSTAISYSASRTLYQGLGTVESAFGALTGLFQGGAAMSPDSYAAARGQSVLDLVKDDLETLERNDMSQADKNKLEAWKALLNQTGQAVSAAECDQDLATALALTQSNLSAVDGGMLGADVLTAMVTDSLDGADIYSNLAVLAAACNANPVIVLKYPAKYVFKGLGMTEDSESLSQRVEAEVASSNCYPNAVADILTIDEYHAQKFAHLVAALDGMAEGDGTLLDGSATVWFQGMSDGAAQNLNNIPVVQAGSCGGYFKTGWAVNVEDGSADLTNGNSESECTGTGDGQVINGLAQGTGTDKKFANAPINKYFYTLMNALGVKADDTGFPTVGGTAEVTRFGMYDSTTDFIGGGTVPPQIHDPGEYDALKAGS
ncbi:MAG TPA: DUF1552 domain-containing protein [Polyangiaceae bacterium]|nr:DUF1552 domain-containing protein [Polyangiaceae bacterium]